MNARHWCRLRRCKTLKGSGQPKFEGLAAKHEVGQSFPAHKLAKFFIDPPVMILTRAQPTWRTDWLAAWRSLPHCLAGSPWPASCICPCVGCVCVCVGWVGGVMSARLLVFFLFLVCARYILFCAFLSCVCLPSILAVHLGCVWIAFLVSDLDLIISCVYLAVCSPCLASVCLYVLVFAFP